MMKHPRLAGAILAAQGIDDHRNAMGVPPLHSLVISAESTPQSSPWKKVSVRDGMDEASRSDDTSQHVAVKRNEPNPSHRLVHPIDLLR
jgi:hypothetical protein